MRVSHSLIIAALLSISLSAEAQQKKATPTPSPTPPEVEDVVRVSTELVQTDVMVFGKDGRFVPGLQREQFELLVDGKPQPVTFFESVVTGGKSEEAVLRAAGGKKPSAPVAGDGGESSERARTIIFFINDMHLDPSSLARTHKTIKNFIDRMGPNDQVAITSASGQIGFLQQLTNNQTVLRAALDRLKTVPGTRPDGERPHMSDYAAYLIGVRNDYALRDYFIDQTVKANNLTGPEGARIAASIVERRVGVIVRQSDIVIKTALSSLVNLVNATAKVPGRKLVFFISDGFVPNFSGSDFTSMMQRATGSANRSGVVIYSLDARGLSVDSSLDASTGGGFDPSGVLQSRLSGERTFMQEPLHALAADTGGRALLNSNDLDGGIQRALDETSRYYLLAWRPENEAQRASNFSKIKVSIVGQPELKVQLRRGYLGAPPEKKKTVAAQPAPVEVENTDVLGVTESSSEELRAAVSVGYKHTSNNGRQLTSTVQVGAQSTGSSGGTVVVNVLGAVFDSQGKAVGSFKQRIEVARAPANATPTYSYVNHQVDVPPGLYQVRVIAAERGTDHLIGVMEWVQIPKTKEGVFSISSLYVGEITQAGGSNQIGVNASRRFARSSRLRFTAFIYNAATPPQLGAQIKVLRGTEAVLAPPEFTISTEKVSSPANIPYTGEFPLSSLTPGNYILELTVTDRTKKTSASQQLHVTVY
jgi:VWFA-related protein